MLIQCGLDVDLLAEMNVSTPAPEEEVFTTPEGAKYVKIKFTLRLSFEENFVLGFIAERRNATGSLEPLRRVTFNYDIT